MITEIKRNIYIMMNVIKKITGQRFTGERRYTDSILKKCTENHQNANDQGLITDLKTNSGN